MGSESYPHGSPRGCGQLLAEREVVALHAHAIADADAVEIVLHVGRLASVAEAHRDPVALVRGAAFLDLVADHRAADGPGDGCGIVAPAAAELVPQHAAGDAAQDGAGAGAAARSALDVDRDDARVVAVDVIAVVRGRRARI